MRRYTLKINDREFVVDVQETAADTFAVTVGGESYAVTLSDDENLSGATIAPGAPASGSEVPRPASFKAEPRLRTNVPAAPMKPRPSTGGGGKAVTAPMPGVILEVSVKMGDRVERGQRVAILDAMKMHNVIGASRNGVIASIDVAEGQTVAHGDVIVRFEEE